MSIYSSDVLKMDTYLPVGWQYVFPSPVYPSLQEHLNEPSVFEHNARLCRQSCDPCTHSSTSKNDKENRLPPAKIPGKISRDGTQETHWNRIIKEKLWDLFVCFNYSSVCLSCLGASYYDEPIDDKFINGERERKKEKRTNRFYRNGFDKIWRKNPPG